MTLGQGEWTSMGVWSDGSYGVASGLIYSFPVTIKDGTISIVQGLAISDFARGKLTVTQDELVRCTHRVVVLPSPLTAAVRARAGLCHHQGVNCLFVMCC